MSTEREIVVKPGQIPEFARLLRAVKEILLWAEDTEDFTIDPGAIQEMKEAYVVIEGLCQ